MNKKIFEKASLEIIISNNEMLTGIDYTIGASSDFASTVDDPIIH